MKTLCTLLSFCFVLLTNKTFSQADPCLGFPETNFTCGQSFTDQRDGTVYSTTQIGFQCWMAENLDFDTVGSVYYDNDPMYGVYGRLYTWNSAMAGSPHDEGIPGEVRGVCPNGWHIASNSEWLYVNSLMPSGGGATLKSTLTNAGIGSWSSPNTGATNSTGFSALPGGYGVPYQGEGIRAYFWTSTESNLNDAWYFSVGYNSAELIRTSTSKTKSLSVRCVMDCNFNTLPIVLLLLKATVLPDGNSVVIEWATASELNSELFVIERSDSGVEDWSVVENISAYGSTSAVNNYAVFDETPFTGINYYRLVEVDIFGTRHYYGVVTVNFRKKFSLSPNPVMRGGSVILPDDTSFDVHDVVGAHVSSVRGRFTADFASGVYFLFPTEGLRSSPDYTPMVLVVD